MIPPHQKKVDELIRLDLGYIPEINVNDYRLSISGDIENPIVFTYSDIVNIGKDKVIDDFHCVTGWTKESNTWDGVLTKEIAKIVKPDLDVRYILIGSYDGYTANVDIDFFLKDNSLLALKHNGNTLTPEHGFPVRLIIPDKYAYKSAKWVKVIKFLKKEELGYWEKRGYSNNADPFKEERYT